ncbi:MAG: CDP-6-deoxy-delta-3,4-glucoseen reductase [Gammaproteobacteria bacterium]
MVHTIRLHPGDERFEVLDEESVLAGGLRAGLHLPHSCRGGSCGACEARVLSGQLYYPNGPPPGLTDTEMSAGRALLCQARARSDLVLEARALAVPEEVRIRRLPCRIESRELLCHDVMRLVVKLPSLEPFVFLAGQYVDFLLENGRRRSYSIANPPHEPERLELHVRRVVGGDFTSQVFEQLGERTLLRLEGPLGGFWLREESERPIVMVAGGTGYAPIKSMLRYLMHTGTQRPVDFYWGVRRPRDLYEGEQVARWAEQHEWLRFLPVMSEPLPEDGWHGRRGWVHEAVLEDHPSLAQVDVYAAGPPPMIAVIQELFPAHGLAPGRLFFDSFEFAGR